MSLDSLERSHLRAQAERAAGQGDLATAFRDWATFSALYPDDAAGLSGLFDVLQKCGLPERAQAVLLAGTMRFPDDPMIMMKFAALAESGGDDVEALQRWRTVRDRFPTYPIAFAKLARLHRKSGRLEDLEGLFDAAALRIIGGQHAPAPKDQVSDLAEAYMAAAFLRNNWLEVVRRWSFAKQVLAHRPRAKAEYGAALGFLKRYDEAETVLAEVIESDPQNVNAFIQFARLANAQGKPEEEVARWQDMIAKLPVHPAAYAGLSKALREQRRFDEAQDCTGQALAQFVDPLTLAATSSHLRQIAIGHGQIAHDRGNYEEALRRWDVLQAALPNDATIRQLAGATRLKISITGLDASTLGHGRQEALGQKGDLIADDSMKHLMTRFESLGWNCEFGLVQRHFGAEPLGLLRWSRIEPETLCNLLEAQFEGMDAPENIEMTITPGQEYFLRDRRYGTGMHTFIKQHEQDAERVLSQLQKRMRYLRGELLEDLRAAEKIFVYKTDTPLDGHMRQRLWAAVQRFNTANVLLTVQVADSREAYDMVEEITPGLLRGFLDRPSHTKGAWDISFDSWAKICRSALAMTHVPA